MTPIPSPSDDDLLRALREADAALPEPPAALLAAALALWPATPPARRTPTAPPARWHTRLVALLSFDSWATSGLAHGMRSASTGPRHLLYTAEGRDLDLRLAAGATGHTLSGQVLGPDEAGEIELVDLAGYRPARRVALDALGEFHLDALPAGTWALAFETDSGVRVELPPLVIGEPPA